MPRTFNVAGPNQPDVHYTLDPEPRLPELRALIEQSNYFVVYAPPKSGKTTLMETLACKLTAEGRYIAIRFSLADGCQFKQEGVESANLTILDALKKLPNLFCRSHYARPRISLQTVLCVLMIFHMSLLNGLNKPLVRWLFLLTTLTCLKEKG